MTHLNNNLTTQMKSFTETVSAQISVLTANMDSRLDKFEDRFLFPIALRCKWTSAYLLYTHCLLIITKVFSVTVVGAAASYLRSQTPVIQTSAIQTPAVQTLAAQAPAVGQN
jgi:hypothetical protein